MGELIQYPLNLESDLTAMLLQALAVMVLVVLLGTLLLFGSVPATTKLISP